MDRAFVDTNILLRHLTGDPADQAQRATRFLEKVERGELKAITTDVVIFEVVFTLLRVYKREKTEIWRALLPLINLPGLRIAGKHHLRNVFDLWLRKNISYVDAYHVVFMEHNGLTDVVSFDHDFDKVDGIHRIEP